MKLNKAKPVINNFSRVVLYAALLILLTSKYSFANGQFELKGRAVGLNGKKIVLIGVPELRTSDSLGTTIIKNGKFSFKGSIATPILARLMVPQSNHYSSFWLMPGTVEVELDTARVSENSPKELVPVVKGSSEQNIYNLFNEKMKILSSDLNREYKKMSAMKDPEEKKKQEEKVSDIREEYTKNSNQFTWDFAKEHNNSFAACFSLSFAINDSYGPIENLASVMNNFTDDVKQSLSYKKNSEELASLLRIQPGKHAPDFTLTDVDGKDLSLSSLKGKVVLIDFWASWCIPCVASIPSMKILYNQYRDKGFEILGVSNDSKIDAWKKCIQQNSIPWKNVVDRFPIQYRPAEIATLYSIHFLPTTLLIDKNGLIVAKNLHDKELEEKIKEIL
ncbi:MAG: AhpC/TSA family protein [Ignavibacteriales bacterium]|nr:AhpC/TSA family protein [Ignavibacteriales bacterium]